MVAREVAQQCAASCAGGETARRLQSDSAASQVQFVRIYKVKVDAASIAGQAGGGHRRVLAEEADVSSDDETDEDDEDDEDDGAPAPAPKKKGGKKKGPNPLKAAMLLKAGGTA